MKMKKKSFMVIAALLLSIEMMFTAPQAESNTRQTFGNPFIVKYQASDFTTTEAYSGIGYVRYRDNGILSDWFPVFDKKNDETGSLNKPETYQLDNVSLFSDSNEHEFCLQVADRSSSDPNKANQSEWICESAIFDLTPPAIEEAVFTQRSSINGLPSFDMKLKISDNSKPIKKISIYYNNAPILEDIDNNILCNRNRFDDSTTCSYSQNFVFTSSESEGSFKVLATDSENNTGTASFSQTIYRDTHAPIGSANFILTTSGSLVSNIAAAKIYVDDFESGIKKVTAESHYLEEQTLYEWKEDQPILHTFEQIIHDIPIGFTDTVLNVKVEDLAGNETLIHSEPVSSPTSQYFTFTIDKVVDPLYYDDSKKFKPLSLFTEDFSTLINLPRSMAGTEFEVGFHSSIYDETIKAVYLNYEIDFVNQNQTSRSLMHKETVFDFYKKDHIIKTKIPTDMILNPMRFAEASLRLQAHITILTKQNEEIIIMLPLDRHNTFAKISGNIEDYIKF